MEKQKKRSVQLGLGIPSIVFLFVLLVMMVIAVLAYLKTNSYVTAAKRQAAYAETYYTAEANLLKTYYGLQEDSIEEQLKKAKMYYTIQENVYIIEEDMDTQILQLSFHIENKTLVLDGLRVKDKDDDDGN